MIGKQRQLRLLLPVIILAITGVRCGQRETPPAESKPSTDVATRDSVRAFWQYYREATRLRQTGDFEAAADTYSKALEQNSSHNDALYYLGNVSYELGEWETADAAWTRLIEVNPNNIRAHAQLGHLTLCRPEIPLFDIEEARLAFESANRLNPGKIGLVIRLAEIAILTDDIDEATELLDDVLGSDEANRVALYLKAFVAWRTGNAAGGIRDLNDALRLLDEAPEAPIPGEGDTKTGSGPALARGARCPLFDSFVDNLRSLGAPVARAPALQHFENFQSRISRLGN